MGDRPDARASILIVDDHPAIRAGLAALLQDESGLLVLPPAAGAEEALSRARRRPPDIALLDVSLDDGDGLRLCLDLKQLAKPPGVLLYTASADPLLALKARLVGAEGLIDKAATADRLRRAIGGVRRREVSVPQFDRELLGARSERLSRDWLAIVGLRLNSTPLDDAAQVLGLRRSEVVGQIRELLEVLDGPPAAGREERSAQGY